MLSLSSNNVLILTLYVLSSLIHQERSTQRMALKSKLLGMFSSGGVGNMSSVNKFFFVLFGGTYGADGDTTGEYCRVCVCVCMRVRVRVRTPECVRLCVCVFVLAWSTSVPAVLKYSGPSTYMYPHHSHYSPSPSLPPPLPSPIFIFRES